jgi:hypothetical protein
MTEIEKIINEMDAMTYGHVQVYVWKPLNGDVLDLAGPLQDLFQSSTGRSSSSSTQNNALQQRMQNGAQNATTTASSSVSGSTGGGGGGGGGGMR